MTREESYLVGPKKDETMKVAVLSFISGVKKVSYQEFVLILLPSAPMVPAVSAALNGALGIQTATHQYVKAKLGEIAPQISKKTAPPPLQTIPPKSPEPQSPSK